MRNSLVIPRGQLGHPALLALPVPARWLYVRLLDLADPAGVVPAVGTFLWSLSAEVGEEAGPHLEALSEAGFLAFFVVRGTRFAWLPQAVEDGWVGERGLPLPPWLTLERTGDRHSRLALIGEPPESLRPELRPSLPKARTSSAPRDGAGRLHPAPSDGAGKNEMEGKVMELPPPPPPSSPPEPADRRDAAEEEEEEAEAIRTAFARLGLPDPGPEPGAPARTLHRAGRLVPVLKGALARAQGPPHSPAWAEEVCRREVEREAFSRAARPAPAPAPPPDDALAEAEAAWARLAESEREELLRRARALVPKALHGIPEALRGAAMGLLSRAPPPAVLTYGSGGDGT